MDTRDKIIEALSKLDRANDAHWTGDGLPRIDVVQEFSGIKDLRRKDITEVAPGLTRDAKEGMDVTQAPVEQAPVEQAQAAPDQTLNLGEDIKRDGPSGDVPQPMVFTPDPVRSEGSTSTAPFMVQNEQHVEEQLTVQDLDDLELAERELEEAKASQQHAEEMVEKAKKNAQEAAARVDKAILARAALAPVRTCVHDIQDYLLSQQKERQARSQVVQAMRAAHIDPRLIAVGSPVDEAMKRKLGYGRERPNFNAKPKAQ